MLFILFSSYKKEQKSEILVKWVKNDMNKKKGRKENQGIMVTNALIEKNWLSWGRFSLGK